MARDSKQLPQAKIIALYRNALLHGIPLDQVEEKIDQHVNRLLVTEKLETDEEVVATKRINSSIPAAVRLGAFFLPLLFITFGLYLVSTAVFPIISYYFAGSIAQAAQLTSPIPSEDVMDVTPIVISQAKAEENGTVIGTSFKQSPKIIDIELDYTNLSNWFDPATLSDLHFETPQDEVITQYILDIPKLNISNAVVEIGGTNLDNNLIAYPGTAKPGEYGAPVIFGHSVLRQFYNPSEKNSRRYNSIFSTIMTLKSGDEIFITYDNVRYTYVVQEKTEVKPTDVYILAQKYDSQSLKLVTCTPEGTYLRRGVVTAQLVKSEGT